MNINNNDELECFVSTIDNGGPIYCINKVGTNEITVNYYPNDSTITIPYQELRHSEPTANPTETPHAVLLTIQPGIYAYICDRIELFRFYEPITYFRSIKGNSSVPYGFAKTSNHVISFNHDINGKLSSIIAIPNNKFSNLNDDEAVSSDCIDIASDSPNAVKNVKSQEVHHNRYENKVSQSKFDSVLAQIVKGTANSKYNVSKKMATQVLQQKYPHLNVSGFSGNVASFLRPIQPITKWGTTNKNIDPLYTPPTIQNNYIPTTGTNIPLTQPPELPEAPKKSWWNPFSKGGKKRKTKKQKRSKKHKKTRKH